MNKLILITGPTCSGKSTLENNLCSLMKLSKIVSFTSRAIREGEKDGVDYHFISKESCEEIIKTKQAVEHVQFDGNTYGISKSELLTKLTGNHAVAVVEPHGHDILIKFCKENKIPVVTVVLVPPVSLLVYRFLSRFSNDSKATVEVYAKRLTTFINKEVPEFYDNMVSIDWPRNSIIVTTPVDFGTAVWNKLIAKLEQKPTTEENNDKG